MRSASNHQAPEIRGSENTIQIPPAISVQRRPLPSPAPSAPGREDHLQTPRPVQARPEWCLPQFHRSWDLGFLPRWRPAPFNRHRRANPVRASKERSPGWGFPAPLF